MELHGAFLACSIVLHLISCSMTLGYCFFFPWLLMPTVPLLLCHIGWVYEPLRRLRQRSVAARISNGLPADFVFSVDTLCPICIESLSAQDSVLFPTCCKKVFHYDCLRKWLGGGRLTCPNDRTWISRDSFVESLRPEHRVAAREQVSWLSASDSYVSSRSLPGTLYPCRDPTQSKPLNLTLTDCLL